MNDDDKKRMDDYYGQECFKSLPYKLNIGFFRWDWSPVYRRIRSFLRPYSVLDDGGGFGALRPYCVGMDYTNLDPSIGMLNIDAGQNDTKVLGVGENLPFTDELFDNVVSCAVLRFVTEEQKYLREAYRVLKHGGVLVLVNATNDYPYNLTRHPFLFWVPLIYNYQKKHHGDETRWKENLMSGEDIVAMIKSTGFSVKHTEHVTRHLPWLWIFKPDSRFLWTLARLFMRKKDGQYLLVICNKP